jgi:hypothetical protein
METNAEVIKKKRGGDSPSGRGLAPRVLSWCHSSSQPALRMPPKRVKAGRRTAGRRAVVPATHHAASPGPEQTEDQGFQQDSSDMESLGALDVEDDETHARRGSFDSASVTDVVDELPPHAASTCDEEFEAASAEVRDLSVKYRATKDTLLHAMHTRIMESLARRSDVARVRPADAAARSCSAAVLRDEDMVPWLKILHCARYRVASMVHLREFLLVLAFTCVYLLALNMQVDAFDSFQVSGAMRGLLVDSQALTSRGEMKGFFDINSYNDWYEWAEIILVDQYYGTSEQDYNGRPITGRMRHMLNWQNRICGGITVLQQRSAKEPCKISGLRHVLSDACTDDDWARNPDTQAYGECRPGLFKACTDQGKFGTGSNVSALLQQNFSSALESSFYVQLGPDENSAKAQLLALQEGNWIDSRTRRIQVFVHVWNFNTDMLQSHEMSVVFHAGGLSRNFFTERHTRTEHYNVSDPRQLLRIVLESVSVAFLVYFWSNQIESVYFSWRGRFLRIHFKSGWNIIDLLHCVSMSAAVISWVVFVVNLPRRHFLQLVDADDDVAALHGLALLDFFPLYDLYVQLSGVTIFFNLLRVLKTFQFHLKTAVVVNTLGNMASPLLSFLIGFSVIFFCLVYIAFINFGMFFMDWHTISFAAGSAVNAIFQSLPLSNIDHLPSFASFYLYWQFAFVFVINFISLNLIVSIIIEGYMLSLERNRFRRYSSQRMADQFAVASIEILCVLLFTLPSVLFSSSTRISKSIQELREQFSGIFGRRLQVHYFGPKFFLNLFDRIDVSQRKRVSFGFIMSELEKCDTDSIESNSGREAVSEVLLHFMECMQIRPKPDRSVGNSFPNSQQHMSRRTIEESSESDIWKVTVQLRDEAVLMLRSHAKTLQKHSDSLHFVRAKNL